MEMSELYICILCFSLVLLFLMVLLLRHYSKPGACRPIPDARRVLIVTAHPDDEAMFFAPTILYLTRSSRMGFVCGEEVSVHLLCLSNGGYIQGQGELRRQELLMSCDRLGIRRECVTVLDHGLLPDNPRLHWNKQLVKKLIIRHVEMMNIDTVVSFDEWGVSGHKNHSAIYHSLQSLYSQGRFPVGVQVFVLETVGILRKYSGIFDVILSRATCFFCFVSPLEDVVRAQLSMTDHWSQLVWFRVLYIFFSRYMIVNSLRRISMTSNYYRYVDKKQSAPQDAQIRPRSSSVHKRGSRDDIGLKGSREN